MPRTSLRVLIAVAIAAGATIASAGTAFANGSSPVAPTQLSSLSHATRQPGDPPDCKYHPTYPGCKKKPVGQG